MPCVLLEELSGLNMEILENEPPRKHIYIYIICIHTTPLVSESSLW